VEEMVDNINVQSYYDNLHEDKKEITVDGRNSRQHKLTTILWQSSWEMTFFHIPS